MTQQKNNIDSNTNRALSILINRNGLSFLIYDTNHKDIVSLKSHDFVDYSPEEELHHFIYKYLTEQEVIGQSFSDVRVCVVNNLSSFVPLPLFDKNKKASYLESHADVRKQDYISFDSLPSAQVANVYIPYVNVNNMLLESFGKFSYVHCSSLLIEVLSKQDVDKNEPYWFVHVQYDLAYFFLMKKGKLHFYNAFQWKNEKDLLYYAMAIAKNNAIELEKAILWISGRVRPGDEIHQLLSNYVYKTSFFTPSKDLHFSISKPLHPHIHTLLLELPTCAL
jgi:hypothetical protein